MEEIKNIEMNDEALEVAEGFVEDCGGSVVGKILGGALLITVVGVGTCLVVKYIKKKKAAKSLPEASELIEVEHTEIVDDDSEEI